MPAPRRAPQIGGRIRWDRASRVGLLIVLVGIVGLYIGPAHNYWSTRHEAAARSATVAKLRAENQRLKARRAALDTPGAVEREARRRGMVRPGEKAFVVRGLPKGG